jgi:hypothetical protein
VEQVASAISIETHGFGIRHFKKPQYGQMKAQQVYRDLRWYKAIDQTISVWWAIYE